jgi:hypothetical protein
VTTLSAGPPKHHRSKIFLGGALKLRAILKFHFLPCGVTAAGVGFDVDPPAKNHFGN